MRALGRSDIGVLLLDGVEGVTDQDTKIAGLIQRQGRGCVMLVNKWDLRRHQPEAQKKFSLELQRQFPFFTFVPILFGSALSPKTVDHLFGAVTRVMDEFSYRVPTNRLNLFLQKALTNNPIPVKRREPAEIALYDPGCDQTADVRAFCGQIGRTHPHVPAIPGKPTPGHVRVRGHAVADYGQEKVIGSFFAPFIHLFASF